MAEPVDPHATAALLAEALASAHEDGGRNGDAHWTVLRALHRRGDRATFEAAAAWCASGDPVVRVLGADVLGQLGTGPGATSPFAGASTAVLRPLLADAEPRVVAAAVQALARLAAADAGLLAPFTADHAAPEVRHAVAQALGADDDAAAVDLLVVLMADPDDAVRSWATFAVASKDGDTTAIRDALAARLDDADADARGEALIGLARRGDPRCAAAIARELAAADPMPLAVDAAELFAAAGADAEEVSRALEAWRTANRRTLPRLEPPPRR